MVVPSAAIASAAAIREGNKRGKAKLDAAAAEGDHAVSTDVEGGQPKRPKSLIRQTTGKMLAYDVLPYQSQVRNFYSSDSVQQIIAVIIMLNFFGNMLEKEIDPPYGRKYFKEWLLVEDIFNWVFRARTHRAPASPTSAQARPRATREMPSRAPHRDCGGGTALCAPAFPSGPGSLHACSVPARAVGSPPPR